MPLYLFIFLFYCAFVLNRQLNIFLGSLIQGSNLGFDGFKVDDYSHFLFYFFKRSK